MKLIKKRLIFSFIVIVFSLPIWGKGKQIYLPEDSIRIEILLKENINDTMTINKRMIFFGLKFLGTPYAGGTLDKEKTESLIINTRELDCTTFAETILALAESSESGGKTFHDFTECLKRIRYRNGEIDGYTSRLHYFSDWIINNTEKGYIHEITPELESTKQKIDVRFMSQNSDKYPQLTSHPEYKKEILHQEKILNEQSFFYIPKERLNKIDLKPIQSGDIIAITTSIPNLDISHVGIAIYKNGRLHLLHASSGQKKVIIEPVPLYEQMQRYKTQKGIRILRPVFSDK